MGYSPKFTREMALVQEQLRRQADTNVRLVKGPDSLCQHYPADQPSHCNQTTVLERDATILDKLNISVDDVLPWSEITARISGTFHGEDIPKLCVTCPWMPYGVCSDGVERIRRGEGLISLTTVQDTHEVVIRDAQSFVRSILGDDSSGHDWWHAERVRRLSKRICEQEGGDLLVCELAALLHDIADDKLGDEHLGMNRIRDWLSDHVNIEIAETVLEIIQTLSYRGGNNPPMRTLDGQIVQDADRLDAIGAIGIARTFAYSGAKGQLIYDPDLLPRTQMTREEYRNGRSTAINHFHEKLLHLYDGLNTRTARTMGQRRHQFMLTYLAAFDEDWQGDA